MSDSEIPQQPSSDLVAFKVSEVYVQGVGKQNEDAVVSRHDIGLFAVIDGATALHADPALSGAVAAAAVKDALLGWDGNSSLIDAVVAANRHLGTVTGGASREKSVRPSCCIAAVRFYGDQLEFVQAGDCMAFVEYQDSGFRLRTLTHDSVAQFDSESVDRLMEGWARHGSPDDLSPGEQLKVLADIRSELRPVLASHRAMMNARGGYSVLDGSPEAERFLEYGRLNATLISRALLVSDGLQLPDGKQNKQESWLETASLAFEQGVQGLCHRVLEMENSDPGCFKYPRLKRHDDKSGLLITPCRPI